MNVYQIDYFFGGNDAKPFRHYVAAETMSDAINAATGDEDISSVQILGGLIVVDVVPAQPETVKATPKQIRDSIKLDGLVSFEDGKTYKSLKRHLHKYGLTPVEYRAKWGLPADYMMVSPEYSARRSELAKASGLGTK